MFVEDFALHHVEIKPMAPEHLAGVVLIEKESFTDPGSEDQWQHELISDIAYNFVACIDSGEKHGIIGYINFWVVAGEVQLNRIAVKKSCRKMGVAAKLMQAMMSVADGEKIPTATLEVRSSNYPAIKLYEKFGFVVKGLRKNYYDPNDGDALIMWVGNGSI